jgi:pre-mRNA-splicing factor 38A
MDEFVDQLLTEERVCDIILPRLAKRQVLEENGDIGPRKSRLLDALEGKSDHGSQEGRNRSTSRSSRGSGRSKDEDASRSRTRGKSLSRSDRTPSDTGSRYVSRSPSHSVSRSPFRSRSRSISPDRMDTEPTG